jgi:glyoxylase-like metal-dependent hydrolase (beta-lactamase superfamily II)
VPVVIRRINTGWLEASAGLSFFGEGRHPELPDGRLRGKPWRDDIQRADGSLGSGTMIPVPVWYVETPTARVLVDTGLPPVEELLAFQTRYGLVQAVEAAPEDDLTTQLAEAGIQAEDIDIVVHTHLHLDHVGGNRFFPNATFLVHEAELAWALCPPPYAAYYYRDFSHHTQDVLDRVTFVGNEHQVTPELRMVWTGGHSPGHCIVLVEAGFGTVALAGDAAYSYENLLYEWPQGPVIDFAAIRRGFQVLKSADLILVNHDDRVREFFPSGLISGQDLTEPVQEYMRRVRTTPSRSLEGWSDPWPPAAAEYGSA